MNSRDWIDAFAQFTVELRSPETPDDERLRTLKYLLHFVGDVHQPLHSSDDHDAGGTGKNVTGPMWTKAVMSVGLQLSKAGVRLATLLNDALW